MVRRETNLAWASKKASVEAHQFTVQFYLVVQKISCAYLSSTRAYSEHGTVCEFQIQIIAYHQKTMYALTTLELTAPLIFDR